MNQHFVGAIVAEANSIDTAHFSSWRGGWPNDIELALLDAVLSIRARYETKNGKGVMPKVLAYRELRNGSADDLRHLAKYDEEELLELVGRQVTGGRTKARCLIEAAQNFVEVGVIHASDFDDQSPEHRRAYTGVKGLGPVTFAYLRMLLGYPDVKADTWVNRFVHRVTGDHKLSPAAVRELVTQAASELPGDVTATALDHAIWRSEAARDTDVEVRES